MICSKCQQPHERSGQRYCKACHAIYMRSYRISHPPSPEAKKMNVARAYAISYLKRGKIAKSACACGNPDSRLHISDVDKPLAVIWVCRACLPKELEKDAARQRIEARFRLRRMRLKMLRILAAERKQRFTARSKPRFS